MSKEEREIRDFFGRYDTTENTIQMYLKYSKPTNKPCTICGKTNSPIHFPMIEGLDIDTYTCYGGKRPSPLCWKCFDEVWTGEN